MQRGHITIRHLAIHGRPRRAEAIARAWVTPLLGLLAFLVAQPVSAADAPTAPRAGGQPDTRSILSAAQWRIVEDSMDRALGWLASRQQPNGAFYTPNEVENLAQPGVSAVVVMAFLARGHLPDQGRYGQNITRAIEFVLSCQKPDGLLAQQHPEKQRGIWPAECAAYNHAISGLMLSEVYGMTTGKTNQRIRQSLDAALKYALTKRPQPKRYPDDKGGWRYAKGWQSSDSDLSVTSWYLMFLRSCRNAGFDVPAEPIDEALGYVKRCFHPREHYFWYALRGEERVWTRAMAGAGILSLSLAGQHQSEMAHQAGKWILRHPFNQYREKVGKTDRFFYGAFYCSHATFQLGGTYWKEFYPVMSRTLVTNQRPDGSWLPEPKPDEMYGNTYSTAMAVLALSPPYQLLPIFQR